MNETRHHHGNDIADDNHAIFKASLNETGCMMNELTATDEASEKLWLGD